MLRIMFKLSSNLIVLAELMLTRSATRVQEAWFRVRDRAWRSAFHNSAPRHQPWISNSPARFTDRGRVNFVSTCLVCTQGQRELPCRMLCASPIVRSSSSRTVGAPAFVNCGRSVQYSRGNREHRK